MNRALSVVGIALTAAYLLGVISLFWSRGNEIASMLPNNIGDFLAGVFGPLAILWLILGFFQQGIELRQNTRALELQANELRNSVQQQKELVSATRTQIEAERESAAIQRERDRQAALPRFLFQGMGGSKTNGVSTYQTNLVNSGATASRVQFEFVPPPRHLSQSSVPLFPSGSQVQLTIEFEQGKPQPGDSLVVKFIDAIGRSGKAEYDLVLNPEGTFCEILPTLGRHHEG